ncbi:hypothetical protein KJ973_02245 [Patescibacteria group bacterium]|nr:hypothetical protein [Patescibacteria group bacterium]MBU1519489.1 hypothetical protein [Patescibacteria group bacterium]MBU2461064.1 hypothetical protein [Patescibacteria group bacterium]
MTITNHSTLNKEDYENRFLGERIIQQARGRGELDYVTEDDITRLFKSVFAQHQGSALRARAEAAMLAFRDYIVQQKSRSESYGRGKKLSVNEILNKNTQNISVQQNVDVNSQEKDNTLQKIIDKNISVAGFSGQLRFNARDAIMKSTAHIVGTGVSLRVMERVVIEALRDFEQTNNVAKEEKKNVNIFPPIVEDNDAEDLSIKPTIKIIPPQNNTVVLKIPIQPEQPVQKKKLTLTEIMLKKAREDDKKYPLVKPQ